MYVCILVRYAYGYHATLLQQVVHDFTALDTESLVESDLHPLAEAGRVVLAQKEDTCQLLTANYSKYIINEYMYRMHCMCGIYTPQNL